MNCHPFIANTLWKSVLKMHILSVSIVPKYLLAHNLILQLQLSYHTLFAICFSRIVIHVFFFTNGFFRARAPFVYSPSLSAIHFLSVKTNASMQITPPERNENVVRRSDSRDNDDRAPRFFTLSLVPKDGRHGKSSARTTWVEILSMSAISFKMQ